MVGGPVSYLEMLSMRLNECLSVWHVENATPYITSMNVG